MNARVPLGLGLRLGLNYGLVRRHALSGSHGINPWTDHFVRSRLESPNHQSRGKRMRRRWKALVAAPLLAFSNSCTDGTGIDPTLEELVLAFCASELPVWFAYQNEGGSWTRVQPNANNAFVFDAADRLAVAMTFDFGTSRLTDVYYVHFNDLAPLSNRACTETSGTKTVNGSVSSVGSSESARISMSSSSTTAFPLQPTWTLTNVVNGPQDLIAHRELTGLSSTVTPNRVIIRRNQNPVSGATLPVLDFGASEALAISTNTLSVTGLLSGESNYYDIDFITPTGTSHSLYQSPFFTSPSQTLYGVPASLTQTGDRHKLNLNADASNGTSYRTILHHYRNPSDKSLVFGATLNTPSVQNITSTPYARLRTTLPSQVDYPDFATSYFIQSSRSVFVTVTATYHAGTPLTWTSEIPDFSAAGGYPTNAGLQSGTQTSWFVEAFNGTLENYIGAQPGDGATVRLAGRSANTSTVQMSVAGERQSPRAILDRRAFRQ